MSLRDYTTEQLIERNIALGHEKDRLMDTRREINAELDRRDEISRAARAILELPDDYQAKALTAVGPELVSMVSELRAEQGLPPAQTLEPVGIESEEVVGTPGRKRFWR